MKALLHILAVGCKQICKLLLSIGIVFPAWSQTYFNASIVTCNGDSTLISATPAELFTGWRNIDSSTNGIATPDQPLTWVYTRESQSYYAMGINPQDNLIYNGDFEAGYKGFWSQYASSPTQNGYNQYTLTRNPKNFNLGAVSKGDHTSGNGNMFVADGAFDPTKPIYGADIRITAGKEYIFSIWLCNVLKEFAKPKPDTNMYASASFEFRVDSNLLGTFKLPPDTLWRNYVVRWKAPTTQKGDFFILNKVSYPYSTVFAIDDISFTEVKSMTSPVLNLVPCNKYQAFSPDGDGLYDDFFIDKPGTAKIFDVAGNLIRQVEAPGSWDGTKNNGSLADAGYYAIVVNEKIIHVSLIR